ncbi:MAG TPA: hypothetical protein VGK28_10380, partial [Candidatus Dormibacteraeota bacterium]
MGLGLFRLGVIDLARRRAMPGVLLVALVTAVALAVALPLMQSVAAEEGLRAALQSLGSGANLEIGIDHVDDTESFDTFQAGASRRVESELGSIMIPAVRFARSNQLQGVLLNGHELVREVGDPLPAAVYYEDLEKHVVVTSGQWPADARTGGAWGATVSELGASLLGLKAGDVYCMSSVGVARGMPFGQPAWCARIGAVFKPRDAGEPYWAGQQLGTDLALGRLSLFQVAAEYPYVQVHANQLHVTDTRRVHAADADSIQAHLQRLHGVYGVISNATFITGLGDAIRIFLQRLRAQQALALSVEIALLAVVLFAIALAAGHYLDSRKQLIGLWRARGGSRLRAWYLLMIQLAVLLLVAVPLGALAGAWAVGVVSSRLFGGDAVLQISVLVNAAPSVGAALLATLAVLALLAGEATLRTVADVRRTQSGPPAGAWWQSRRLDLVLAVLGLLLIAEYRLQAGHITVATGQDPLALILPAVALALVAAGALRLLPLLARLIARGRGLGARLARWHLEREPLQHAPVALLLSFALALSLFTSAYLATDQRNAVDRARYAAGADVRLSFGFGTGPSVVDAAVAATPGVIASSLVYRGEGRPGRSDVSATVLGLDGHTFANAVWWRSDFAARPVAGLMQDLVRDDPDGVPVPGQPAALSMWVYSSGLDASLSAELKDAAGGIVRATFGSMGFQGWSQLQAPLTGLGPKDFPLRLRTLLVSSTGSRSFGEIALSDLRAGTETVEDFTVASKWWREVYGEFGGVGPLQVSAHERDGKQRLGMPVNLTNRTLALHPAPSSAPLPGLMSTRTAQDLGVSAGQTFPLHINTNDVMVRLVGMLDYFPTVYPGQDDFLLLPSESLTERLRLQNSYVYANEAWLRVSGSPAAAGAAVQEATHGAASVVDRETLETSALQSPLRLSLDAALVIGFVAALAMVVITFGLHFLAIARARVSESAIMQANGLPWRVVDQALIAEQVVVLCHSVVVGAALGLLLAWAILPVVQTSVLPADVIPPTIVSLDAATLLAAALALFAAAGIVGQLAMRTAGRFR